MKSRVCASLLLSLVSACGSVSVEGTDLGAPPSSLRGFQPQNFAGIVYAEARYADHETALDVDLVDEEQTVPIQLKVQMQGRGAQEAQIMLNPRRMDLRLLLPDGTEIRSVDSDGVAERQDDDVATLIRDRAFRGGLLQQGKPSEGFLFFPLQPDAEFDIEGRVIKHLSGGIVRSFDLADSLLAFNLSIGAAGEVQPFYVGIQR